MEVHVCMYYWVGSADGGGECLASTAVWEGVYNSGGTTKSCCENMAQCHGLSLDSGSDGGHAALIWNGMEWNTQTQAASRFLFLISYFFIR